MYRPQLVSRRVSKAGEHIMEIFELLTFLPRLVLFFLTLPLRLLGINIDFGLGIL